VVPAIETGWQTTSREAILDARERAATAMLQRTVGEQPEGLGPTCSAAAPTRPRGKAARRH
jgi:hypothetical protein